MRFAKATLVKVIVFAMLCVLMTIGLGVRLANRKLFTDHFQLTAVFDNALGVLKGDAVKIAGVDVGRVEGTRIENGKALVDFTVEEGIEVPEDSMVAIRWRNVLGQRFLYVFPGISTENLVEGDSIPVSQTSEAGDIGAFLNRLGPILRSIDPEKANAFVESLNTAIGGQEAIVRQLIGNGASLAGDLGEIDNEIAGLVESSDKILSVFASEDDAIKSILDDLNSLGGVLDNTTDDINTVVTNFDDVQDELYGLLSRNRSNIDSTIDSLDIVTKTLATNRRNLARTLCTLPIGLAGYFQTTSWGEWFNVRIVDVVVQNENSEVLVSADELSSQRNPEKAPASYIGCAGTGNGIFRNKQKEFANTTPEDPVTGPVEDALNMILPDGSRP